MTAWSPAWLTIAALSMAAAPSSQAPTFRARIEGVRIDVLVTERGRPVAGLGPADFEVRDNGVLQTIDLVSHGDVPLGALLALDLSASVDGPQLVALQRAGRLLLDGLRPEDAAALVTFNRTVMQRVPFTRRIADVRRILDTVTAEHETALVDAALSAVLLADADGGRNLIVVFSDGTDTASFVPEVAALDTARRSQGVVYGVSSEGEDPRFLRELSEVTGGRLIELDGSGDPGSAFRDILDEFRRRYLITFTPTGVAAGGWHRLDVGVKRRGTHVQARAGYQSAAP